MELLGLQIISLFQVDLHQFLVNLHDLVDEPLVGGVNAIKCRVGAVWLKKTIRDAFAIRGRQIDRQAFRAERLSNFFDQFRKVDIFGIGLVDDYHFAESLRAGCTHHATSNFLDTGLCIQHDCGGLDSRHN